MKSFDQLRSDLARQLRKDMPVYFVDGHSVNAETVANWILREYKPPTEWETRDGGLSRTLHSFRVTIAGQYFKYTATITDEQAVRDSRVVIEIKKRIRWMVGRTISDFLAGEEVIEREPVE